MPDYNDEMNRDGSEIDRGQSRLGEDTHGFGDEEFEDVEDLDQEEAEDELEGDERVTGEVGSEGGGEGNVSVNREPSPGRDSDDISEP